MSSVHTCTVCKQTKLKTEFYSRKNRPCGVHSVCKLCCSDKRKEKYKNNREQIKESIYKYRDKNLEKVKESQKKYHENNKEQRNLKTRKYYTDNKERLLEQKKDYRKRAKDNILALCAKRRAAKNNAVPPWLSKVDLAKIRSIYKTANTLFKKSGVKYHVDHIVPLQGKTVCGLHVPWNLQLLTAEENIRKTNKLIEEDIVCALGKPREIQEES